MRNGHGGARRGAGRPMGRRNLRPIGALQSILTEDEKHLGLIPVEFSGDSLEFLRATMMGKIWPLPQAGPAKRPEKGSNLAVPERAAEGPESARLAGPAAALRRSLR